MSTKKEAAASVLPGPQQQSQHEVVYPDSTDTKNMAFTDWDGVSTFGETSTSLPNNPPFDSNLFGSSMPSAELLAQHLTADVDPATSNQLVRRNRNNQLALQNRSLDPNTWQELGTDAQAAGWENAEDDEDLEEKALQARKEAQSKRKTIPPFVQKLSSFLDEKRNTDLIRWADDGNSFIVLNEDEFAKTLIPELFKHNNYASFVRQLNMYGFHKKVGLSDNSMKSSESKVKNPSEYYNKYFKRGRPELLWLIQKPKTAAAGKRKRDDDKPKGGDSDDEAGKKYLPAMETRSENEGVVRINQDMAVIPSREITNMKSELRSVQQQQKLISQAISRIRQQNDQLYNQARAFQTLHDRHENSINAILTFLATFYNRSLETNNGPNLAEMFAHAMPQNNQNHGSVVDVGDYHVEQDRSKGTPLRRRPPLALLPAPETKDPTASPSTQATRAATTRSPSMRPVSWQNGIFKSARPSNSPVAKSKSPPIKSEVSTPNATFAVPENDEIMSVIQNSNANHDPNASQGPQLDFDAALNHFQNSSDGGQLTAQQRNQLLSYMAANSPISAAPNDNALLNPDPPPIPSLDTFTNTQSQLDILQKMQQEQNDKVQALADRLQPLSPTGSIPGYVAPSGDSNNFYGNFAGAEPSDLDINSFINSDDYFPNTESNAQFASAGDSTIPGLDLDFDNANAFNDVDDFGNGADDLFGTNGGDFTGYDNGVSLDENRIESVSSGAPSPANPPESIPVAQDNTTNPRKKRKNN
ncbi:hypothetical protein EJ05DRAFT_93350 [Pseudovirgaria hyperparasitica]|uniref:HSF-type DNA-binding domain-containing protein n=1 Tax=Pseudovirgaria hyperparasitica TaxID=470096 RepID=A0A6A6VZV0_9PEZI|nr:uncharacterized protein EJ05DRAFT_93350 [Pseudovirgaria hyperparasitica]KAF2756198.1 hypothetical protein EJ05DRAFT_93350 [Pseudovirgaria hyperparasitica]